MYDLTPEEGAAESRGSERSPKQADPAVQAQQRAAALPRRPKACMYCRSLKLRCDRGVGDPKDECERCVVAGRQCIIPDSKRKKPRRLGSGTVAALEKKVDFLVSRFTGGDTGSLAHADKDSAQYASAEFEKTEPFSAQPLSHSRRKRSFSEDVPSSPVPPVQRPLGSWESHPMTSAKRDEILSQFSFFTPRRSRVEELYHNDVVSRGLLSLEDAERSFQQFTKFQLPHFPVLVFPEMMTASSTRRTKPALFLAILGVGSAVLGQEVQRMLNSEIMHTFADRIIIRGEKNLDLVQALEVSILWYYPPENYEEVKFYQLCHIAAAMSLELGLGQRSQPYTSRLYAKDLNPESAGIDDRLSTETLAEGQRAWLVCYILCGIASMTARRPSTLRWTHYMDYCIMSLETCATAFESDRLLCQWARGQRIAEEIAEQFHMDDPSAKVDIHDGKVQFILHGFEQQLEKWRNNIPVAALASTLQYSFHLMNLYLHEIALHVEHNINDFRPPFVEETLRSASAKGFWSSTPTQRKSLAICIFSVKEVLETFLGFDSDTLCSMPIFNFVRAAYATVALIKIQLMVLRTDTDLANVIKQEDLMVDSYFHRLRQSLQAVVQMRKLRVAVIFNLVIQMLQAWFQRQGRQIGLTEDDQSVLGKSYNFGSGGTRSSQGAAVVDSMPSSSINQRDASDDTDRPLFNESNPFPDADLQHSMSDIEMQDWREYDFATLFTMDDRRLFEAARGWLGLT